MEACAQSPRPGIDVLDAIAAEAWALAPPAPHERKWVLRSEAGLLLDRLLSRCARGRGALDCVRARATPHRHATRRCAGWKRTSRMPRVSRRSQWRTKS